MPDGDTFRAWLARHNIGVTEFCRAVERIGGRRPALRTIQEWARDPGRMSAADWALLAMMERHREEWMPTPSPETAPSAAEQATNL